MSSIVKQKYPIKLRGTAMEEFKIFEATLLNLFPCAAQRYRGSAHRARGLVLQKNPMCFFFNPSLRRCRSSVSPLYFAPQKHPAMLRDTAGGEIAI